MRLPWNNERESVTGRGRGGGAGWGWGDKDKGREDRWRDRGGRGERMDEIAE